MKRAETQARIANGLRFYAFLPPAPPLRGGVRRTLVRSERSL